MAEKISPQQQQIYHIFLASPGDMQEERQLARDFFAVYNRNTANRQNIEFKVVDWEHYSNSGLGRPQALITRQTLEEFRNSLVLVIGLLGQRFGTPTGGYDSGTEEEFATALRFRGEQGDWPEIKWFFRQGWGGQGMPKDPEQGFEVNIQWKRVLDFKARLQTSEPQFLTVEFPDTTDFERVFRQDLERWLHDPARPWYEKSRPETTLKPDATPAAAESPYLPIWLKLLAADCARLPLEILDVRQGDQTADPILLPDIFVPLKAMPPSESRKRGEKRDLTLDREMEPTPVLDILAEQRLAVVIGDPGSGKTALVNQLTWSLLASGPQPALPPSLQGLVPVRIILRRVQIPRDAKKGQACWLWQALETEIREALDNSQQAGQHAPAIMASLQRQLLGEQGGLILLDGLDEVPEADRRRVHLLQAIQELVASLPEPCRFIVTARPYAYTNPLWRLPAFTPLVLTPFDPEQREQFIHGWYAAARQRFYALRDSDLQQRIPDLIARVENQPHLRELAERPLLLTLIATLHAGGGRLPEDRARLYKDSVDLLLFRWRQQATRDSDGQPLRYPDEAELLACLRSLAYQAHRDQQTQGGGDSTADIRQEDLLRAFEPLVYKLLCQADLLAFLQQHTGILIARAQQRYAFPHRSFQEYLAMGWLTAQSEDRLTPEVCADPLWWREVFRLAVLEQRDNPRFAKLMITDLLKSGAQLAPDSRRRLFILAGLALLESNRHGMEDLTQEIREELVALLADAAALNPGERAEAGRVLAGLGDPRPGVGLNDQGLPDIVWCNIPGGEVVLEDDAGRFQVAAFDLARFPVTNRQFQSFIDDPDGYANPRWWQGLDAKPGTPVSPWWSDANHPRETVSWYEAMAFCAWLSARLGFAVSLPTEWQWQQAACSGRADYDYPWGADYRSGYANIDETEDKVGPDYLGRTTAVGIYPQGDSEQGVADLSGNVWEWCLDVDNQSYMQIFGGFSSVVRGGSWIFNRGLARAAYRYSCFPDIRLNDLGFRVCRASPHPDAAL